MPRLADARVDRAPPRRPSPASEVGVVASPGHRARVVRVEQHRSEDEAGPSTSRQKLYRSASTATCELRRYWPRKSSGSPPMSDAGERSRASADRAPASTRPCRTRRRRSAGPRVSKRDAAVRIDRVRRARRRSTRVRPRSGANVSAGAARGHRLHRHSRRRTPIRRSGARAGRRRARTRRSPACRTSKYAASPLTVNQRVGTATSRAVRSNRRIACARRRSRRDCGSPARRVDVRQMVEAVEERQRVLEPRRRRGSSGRRPASRRERRRRASTIASGAASGGTARPALIEQRHAAGREPRHPDQLRTCSSPTWTTAAHTGDGQELGVDDVEEVARRKAVGRRDDVGLAPADELLADIDGEAGRARSSRSARRIDSAGRSTPRSPKSTRHASST